MMYSEIKERKNLKYGLLSDYINKMCNGDKLARNIIIEYYINTVVKIVEKEYDSEYYNKEELVSVGILGMMEAISTYNNNLKARLSIRVQTYIKREIDKYINNNITVESLNDYRDYSDGDMARTYEQRSLMLSCLEDLTVRDKQVVELYLTGKYTLKNLSKEFDISIERVRQILERYKKSVYSVFQDDYIEKGSKRITIR